MAKFIFVPQHCYAIITPETSHEYQGLFTSGLSTCTGVTISVSDSRGGYYCLCHADAGTLLSDPDEGIPAWIRFLRVKGCTSDLVIHYDVVTWPESPPLTTPDSGKFSLSTKGVISSIKDDILRGDVYGREINDAIASLSPEEQSRISLKKDTSGEPGLILDRSCTEPYYLRDAEYEITTTFHGETELPDFIFYWGQLDETLSSDNIVKYPPLCIFDSTALLSIEEMKERYKTDRGELTQIGQALESLSRLAAGPSS